jgi:hypothetical protein
MQTILTKLPNEKAAKELKQFAVAGVILSLVALFIFWFLAIMGVAFSFRALLLTFHKGNSKRPRLILFRIVSIFGLLLGIADLILYAAGQ